MENAHSNRRSHRIQRVGEGLLALGVGLILLVMLSAVASFPATPDGGLFVLGMVLFGISGILLVVSGRDERRAALAAPAAALGPALPTTASGTVALSCPRCGAPAENVDHLGPATCPHCGAAYIVE